MERILTVAVLLLAGINTASAAVVTNISNLQIGESYYDVTIHTTGSFNDIWDFDGDGIFGDDDGSRINRAPMFWGSTEMATLAAQAVMQALGSDDTWRDDGYDGTKTPYQYTTAEQERVDVWYDKGLTAAEDYLGVIGMLTTVDPTVSAGHAFVSYEEVAPVPLPAAVWLFGSALAGLCLVTRKRESDDAA